MKKGFKVAVGILAAAAVIFGFYRAAPQKFNYLFNFNSETQAVIEDFSIPEYEGELYVEVNDNKPFFTQADYPEKGETIYSGLDKLGRCTRAEGCIGPENLPTEERGRIGEIKPTGWHLIKYDVVDDMYLYNRCHLIAFSLDGQNANEKNLVTGTSYMNKEGMQPFELTVLRYIRRTGNHVVYRVTPVFEGNELICRGILMEAQSLEDNEIMFNVYCFNVQPGVEIDYSTGDSRLVKK